MKQWFFAMIAAFTLSGHVDAAAVTPQNTLVDDGFFKQAIAKLAAVPGFSCHFVQVMIFSDGGGQSYAGEVAVKKPKRFRWSYDTPYVQLYIGDGTVIWHYEPDLMQAERLSDLEQVDPAVMKLLDGRIGVSDLKLLDRENTGEGSMRRYRVSIKDSEPVWLGFSAQGDLIQIERQDMLGNRNRMKLSACSYVAPSENLFSFTPPDGVDVLDMRTSSGL